MVNHSTVDHRESAIWKALESVADPEIPVLSVIELGMIAAVTFEDHAVVVDLTPTFVGCPAIDVIRGDIVRALTGAGERQVAVNIVYDPPWTSSRISPEGRRKLKEFGLAPPGPKCSGGIMPDLRGAQCPFCQSTDTKLESIFGPTLCRAIHYCSKCLQSFEEFKTI